MSLRANEKRKELNEIITVINNKNHIKMYLKIYVKRGKV